MTHDPKIDDRALVRALSADCFYIGALGSRKTHAKRIERMRAEGFDEAALARIHAPIGLDIGAVSPAEIAVSIVGEIVAALRKKPLARRRRGVVKFGAIPVAEAENAILAHGLRLEALTLKKGQIVTAERRRALSAAGVAEVVAARLEPGDVGEDEAARRLAERLAGAHLRLEPPFTGRVNLFAREAGLVVVDAEAIRRVNGVDEAITVATLAPFRAVAAGDMAATVKIIPFADARRGAGGGVRGVAGGRRRCRSRRSAPCASRSPRPCCPASRRASSPRPCRRSRRASRPPARRSSPRSASRTSRSRSRRALERLAAQGDALVIFGASAITDRRDVIPAAIEAIGGRIERFGMPVDPGNLLLLAARGDLPIVGAPGCARSPKENGFDWVLQRILAGVPIDGADIEAMGVGGLLMEIASRPQPRLGDG